MLNYIHKQILLQTIIQLIPSSGIDTRLLANNILQQLQPIIPVLNHHHIYGMMSYILRAPQYAYILNPRKPGKSTII